MIQAIDKRLAELINKCGNPRLREAMAYSALSGGKRLRAMILLGACEAVMGKYTDAALDFACAVEMIHAYSLIHDDLPAMDNDDFRRGLPTNHVKFGEAMAILAGDALLNRAFETLTDVCISEPKYIKAMSAIAAAAGDNGMIAGQTDDIFYENKIIDKDTLNSIHMNKTGALFAAAFYCGAYIGGADEAYANSMKQIGKKFGLVFQIMDDILDVTANQEILGKPVNSDKKNNKTTYVSLLGLDKALDKYKLTAEDVLNDLSKLKQKTPALMNIIINSIERER